MGKAKNNTNRPGFTHAERQMAAKNGGSKTGVLGRESLRSFDACALCQATAADPRVCEGGHITCFECVVNDLLAQKKDIKRQEALLAQLKVQQEAELEEAKVAARERVLADFERAQSGGQASSGSGPGKTQAMDAAARGTKRKFALDSSEVSRLTEEAEAEALEQLRTEQAAAKRAKLPNFWLPSLTPDAKDSGGLDAAAVGKEKLSTLCKAAKPAHPTSLKALTPVKFHHIDEADPKKGKMCPVCRKALTNSVKSFVVRACHDVICSTCIDTLCATDPEKSCAHCGERAPKKGSPWIEIKTEGTGYASRGGVEVKKFGLAFQG